MSQFTISQVVSYGDSRGWRPLVKRAFAEFRRQFGIPGATCQFSAANAFAAAYEHLAAATAGERAALAAMADQELAWRSVRAAIGAANTAAANEQWLRDEASERRRNGLVAELRSKRCWRICGQYLEDRSVARYTLDELEAWRDWAAYLRFSAGSFQLSVAATDAAGSELVALDWTGYFQHVDHRGGRRFDIEEVCKDLASFTGERRASAAASNSPAEWSGRQRSDEMTTTYTTVGSVRGGCGHNHTTIRGAARCARQDQRDCKAQGGYSDRNLLVRANGEVREPTEAEYLDWSDRLTNDRDC
jgi:hypothetical protein